MTNIEFSTMVARPDIVTVGNTVYGQHNGYPYTVTLLGKYAMLRVSVTVPVKNSVRKALTASVKPMCGKVFANGNDTTTVCVRFSDAAAFEEVLRTALDVLQQNQLTAGTVCPLCKQEGCDCAAMLGPYVPAHRSCVEARNYSQAQQAKANLENGNYFTGILGALLGAILGAIPATLALVFANYLVGILFALIPMGAYYGYKLLRGKMNLVATVAVIFMSLLTSFVIEQVWFLGQIAKEFNVVVSIFDSVSLYLSLYTVPEMLEIMGTQLMFVALGIFISWRFITNTGKAQIQNAASAVSTITPPLAPSGTVQELHAMAGAASAASALENEFGAYAPHATGNVEDVFTDTKTQVEQDLELK